MKVNDYALNANYRYNREAKGVPISKDSKESKLAKKYRRKIAGKTLSQFDNEFWEYLLFLINQYTPQERNEIVEEIVEYYMLKTGNQPPNTMLTALADFLLDDTLSNTSTSKVQNEEYPVMSWRQLGKRYKREIGFEPDILEFLANERKHPRNKRNTSESPESK